MKIFPRYSGTEFFFSWYKFYLLTKEWKRIRKRVIKRAKGICETCKIEKIVDVHHLSYKNLGKEKLCDLRGLCRECHSIMHDK